jgi:hypothetical protein
MLASAAQLRRRAYRFHNRCTKSSMPSNRLPEEQRRVAGLLGLAFDADDGHKRITRGKNFLLAGGSEETHLLMRETIIKVNERLDERGQHLADVSVDELRDLIDEVQD